MARMEDIPQPTRDAVLALQLPQLPGSPWVTPPPLRDSRVAILTSAALHGREDPPFEAGSAGFRRLDTSRPASDLLMTHISINFDRTGFHRDPNVAYPLDRLRELADEGLIGSVAPTNYSVMGSTDPLTMDSTAAALSEALRAEAVDALLLCPV
ncbi:MAG: selenoprotein B glycine/betaine/sarcosine/D-proline reductase [Gammaproteobacteria bacterium]|nr:selenoprotein B glycine/betaine/sarcosine/D-proline reductase [Gammaproteobacteria bacterium]